MAAYPSFNMQRGGSRMITNGGHRAVRATNGALRLQRLYSSAKREFQIEHWLTTAQKTTHQTFYSANKDLDVDLTWPEDNVTYTVRFVEEPQYYWRDGAFWVVTVKMAEV